MGRLYGKERALMKILKLFITAVILTAVLSFSAFALYENGEGIYSDNVYMENLETGRVVLELDADERVYPASLTKILTCIIAIEKCQDLNEVYEIPRGIFDDIYAQGGAHLSIKYGERLTVGDLLHATMIRSACDSATALACYVSGSVEAFAEVMNEKAEEIGAVNSHFVNAHGLHDDDHYTTAKDMSLIAKYALQNSVFCDIISKWCYTIPATDVSDERYFESTMSPEIPDSDDYYPALTGIKSGFTDEAGRCLITKAEKDSESYLLVTLGANRDRYYLDNMAFTDAVNLHEYAFARFDEEVLVEKDTALTEAAVENGKAEKVDLVCREEISYLRAVDEDVEITYTVPDSVTAPVNEGDEIGSVTVKVGDFEITKPLYALSGVDELPRSSLVSDSKFVTVLNFSSLAIFLVSVLVLVVFCLIFFRKKNRRLKP